MRIRISVLLLTLGVAVTGCGGSDPVPVADTAAALTERADAVAQLDQLYADYWEASLELRPLQATFIGDSRFNDRLPDFLSVEYRQRQHDFEQHWLERVSAVDASQSDQATQLSRAIFIRGRELALEGERFPDWLQPIDQYRNLPQTLLQLGSGDGPQPFVSLRDYANWQARASAAPTLVASAIRNMREGIAAGVVQPRALMLKVLPQLESVIDKDRPEDTLFWGPINKLPADFSEADKQRITNDYRSLIADQLLPSFAQLRDFIRDEYLLASRESVGQSALPDGAAWYAYNVRLSTSTELSPEEIHQIGLDEVARIHGQMQSVMTQVGFSGDLQAFFAHLNKAKEFQFADEQDLLDAYNGLRATVEAGVPKLFSLTPKADFEIRPVEAYRAASAAGGNYQRPSEDGSRAGIFFVNTYDLPTRTRWRMESLFLHEAIPGHHFQLALQQELGDLPKFRRFGREIAFSEGWGLYAESLGKELGVYTDPYQYFGRLQAELWRAIRLVVDTGLHAKGWTREQVIAYMLTNSATSNTSAVSETERYMAMPGQALAYKIGELKIQQLRARAEQALGDRFDIRAFHAEVLRNGSIPLTVLEARIERWIEGV